MTDELSMTPPPEAPAGWTPPTEAAMMDIEDPFADLDKAFEATEAKGDFSDDLPDGRYSAFSYKVKPYKVENGKKAGYSGICVTFRVMTGEQRGQTQNHMRSFHAQDTDSMGWLKKDLANMGILDDMKQEGVTLGQLLTTRMNMFLDRVCEIQVKRTQSSDPNNPFVNVYVNRVIHDIGIPADLMFADGGTGGGGGSTAF